MAHPDSAAPQERPANPPRSSYDDRQEEANRQVREQQVSPPEMHLFSEWRRKLALGETLSRAFEKLAQALRFSGRITISFHQGQITKTVMEEAHFRGKPPA
jgi:hypothetical protein